jgi:hypothetical protein
MMVLPVHHVSGSWCTMCAPLGRGPGAAIKCQNPAAAATAPFARPIIARMVSLLSLRRSVFVHATPCNHVKNTGVRCTRARVWISRKPLRVRVLQETPPLFTWCHGVAHRKCLLHNDNTDTIRNLFHGAAMVQYGLAPAATAGAFCPLPGTLAPPTQINAPRDRATGLCLPRNGTLRVYYPSTTSNRRHQHAARSCRTKP